MIRILGILFLCSLLSACISVDVTGYVVPGEILHKDKSYFIAFSKGDEHALHNLLQQGLARKGLAVSSGFVDRIPENTDYIVEYGGQWQWDVTWYLLNFDVRVYHSDSKLLIASASSLRTSLGRKPPESVVAETLNQIFVD